MTANFMKVSSLHDKEEIERFLRHNTFLHIYSIGDLDDFFWENTVWYALKHEGEIKQIILMYTALEMPTVLAFTEQPEDEMRGFLGSILPLLPSRFYTHLTQGLRSLLEEDYEVQCHGTFYKMALTDMSRLDMVDTSSVTGLTSSDLGEVAELYKVSYPGNWFDPRMLETGHYYGLRRDNALIGVAGVHVYSDKYKVAALGNVTTHPQYRGQGIATACCASLCHELSRTVEHIGLNVKADNKGAIASYRKLGFEAIATYEECTVSRAE
ncbi:MAG: GNAT family N-acetyltransferase [Chloroflexia bacterium]